MSLGYLPNPVCPLLPVVRVGVLVHHHRQDGVPKLRRPAEHERQFDLLALAVAVGAVAVPADVCPAWLPRRRFLGIGDQP